GKKPKRSNLKNDCYPLCIKTILPFFSPLTFLFFLFFILITMSVQEKEIRSFSQRLVHSPVISAIAGSFVLWSSFGVRQTFGVFLIPITTELGWSRSTFSIAAALFQLLWGFSQPFLVYLAERKFGFGKTIALGCLFYAAGCFILYASDISPALFIVSMGVIIGISAGCNSFPTVLASVGRRLPQKSPKQAIYFGIVSGFGSFGQCAFLPMARGLEVALGWRYSFVVLGGIMAITTPCAYFLQTVPPLPPLLPAEKEKTDLLEHDVIQMPEDVKPTHKKSDSTATVVEDDFSAPDIKTALREAFSSPTFIMITCGFSVCGFHLGCNTVHVLAWTMSILGLGSMIGSMSTGFITKYISPRNTLVGIYFMRAVMIVIFVFIPISIGSVIAFSIVFGVSLKNGIGY
ncbi:major facilitator superfamily domain-containing protein, partial [Pilobolus umbonatus]